MIITLRIKKIFFDQIVSGEKKIEYRELNDYYRTLFDTKARLIHFHYQKIETLICGILSIDTIDNPKPESPYLKTSRVYAIAIDPLVLVDSSGAYRLRKAR